MKLKALCSLSLVFGLVSSVTFAQDVDFFGGANSVFGISQPARAADNTPVAQKAAVDAFSAAVPLMGANAKKFVDTLATSTEKASFKGNSSITGNMYLGQLLRSNNRLVQKESFLFAYDSFSRTEVEIRKVAANASLALVTTETSKTTSNDYIVYVTNNPSYALSALKVAELKALVGSDANVISVMPSALVNFTGADAASSAASYANAITTALASAPAGAQIHIAAALPTFFAVLLGFDLSGVAAGCSFLELVGNTYVKADYNKAAASASMQETKTETTADSNDDDHLNLLKKCEEGDCKIVQD